MSSVFMGTRISEMGLDIQKIFKKISELEKLNNNLSQKLKNEISQRQNLEKHTLTSNEATSLIPEVTFNVLSDGRKKLSLSEANTFSIPYVLKQ